MTDSRDSDEVVDIASQVADGAPVDWQSARDQAVEDSRHAIEQLRTIAEIARFHRDLQRGTASAAPAEPEPPPDGVPWGPLFVFEKRGSGSFGEVFRAWDPSLKREVALKLLRNRVGGDAAVEEGQRLARLSHPNVMAVYGAQRVGTQVGIWGELLNGKTLAALIGEEGPMSADETLIAGESICRALAAVHRGGMLHRDVKAQNVFRERGGRLVLMDFGLGRELDAAAAPGDLSGTPVYLAPELFGDGRPSVQSDLYSLGVLLFFLATGKFPVGGGSLDEIRQAHREGRRTRLQDLRPELPRQLVHVVERALDPDPAKRYESAGAMQTALARAVHGDDARVEAAGGGRVAPITVVLACAGVALAVAAILWAVWRKAPSPPPVLARFTIAPPPAQSLDPQDNDRNVAISPDGRSLVYRSGGTSVGGRLMLRPIDRLDAHPLPRINNGRGPFYSPDGQWVGFFDDQELKKIALAGESAVLICRLEGVTRGVTEDFPRGASWGDDNTIVFATNDKSTGLWRVSAAGGTPEQFTTPDQSQGEQDHLFPSVLPGKRGVLFTIQRATEPVMQVAVYDARTGQSRPLIQNATQAEYVPPPAGSRAPGYLLYASAGTLQIVRFNLDALQVVGKPMPVVENLQIVENGAANYAVAGTGTLVYLAGAQEPPRSLVWVDRSGVETRIDAPDHTYAVPRISPDGRRAVVEVRAGDDDLWIWDFEAKRLEKLPFGRAFDRSAVWDATGQRILFSSDKEGRYNVYARNADGTGSVEQVTTEVNAHPTSFSAVDGSIVCTQYVKARARIVRLKSGTPLESLLGDAADQRAGQISPNGRFIAYQSNESGRAEVHVRAYPSVAGGHWQVSTEGGSNPMWSKNGTELFFLDAASFMTAVPVVTSANGFSHGDPKKLFDARIYGSGGERAYDVSLNGSQFLLIKDASGVESSVGTPAIRIVVNWFEEVRSKLDNAAR